MPMFHCHCSISPPFATLCPARSRARFGALPVCFPVGDTFQRRPVQSVYCAPPFPLFQPVPHLGTVLARGVWDSVRFQAGGHAHLCSFVVRPRRGIPGTASTASFYHVSPYPVSTLLYLYRGCDVVCVCVCVPVRGRARRRFSQFPRAPPSAIPPPLLPTRFPTRAIASSGPHGPQFKLPFSPQNPFGTPKGVPRGRIFLFSATFRAVSGSSHHSATLLSPTPGSSGASSGPHGPQLKLPFPP